MDYVMRRRSTVGGALEMFSLPLPLAIKLFWHFRVHLTAKFPVSGINDENVLVTQQQQQQHMIIDVLFVCFNVL